MPLLLLLLVNIGRTIGEHPVVAEIVHNNPIIRTGGSTMLANEGIFPHHLSPRTVDSHQITIARCHDKLAVILSKRREPELLGKLLLTIAILRQCLLLRLGIITIETVRVSLYPNVFLRIDINTVYTSRNSQLSQIWRRITHGSLCNRVEDTVIHALLQPELTVDVLPDHIHIIIPQRRRIVGIRIEDAETIAVITVESVWRTYPYNTLGVLKHTVNLRV